MGRDRAKATAATGRRIGHADDKQAGDGQKVLSYEQAAERARAGPWRCQRRHRPARHHRRRGRILRGRPEGARPNAYNARKVRSIFRSISGAAAVAGDREAAPRLARQPDQGRHAAGDPQPGDEKRARRVQLAAKLDKRVAANARAWKIGLEALPGTVKAREAVLTDAQVLAVVAAAYDVSAAFGLYVQVHAEVGARSSQLARLKVADLSATG